MAYIHIQNFRLHWLDFLFGKFNQVNSAHRQQAKQKMNKCYYNDIIMYYFSCLSHESVFRSGLKPIWHGNTVKRKTHPNPGSPPVQDFTFQPVFANLLNKRVVIQHLASQAPLKYRYHALPKCGNHFKPCSQVGEWTALWLNWVINLISILWNPCYYHYWLAVMSCITDHMASQEYNLCNDCA